jgi:hypothetical protein
MPCFGLMTSLLSPRRDDSNRSLYDALGGMCFVARGHVPVWNTVYCKVYLESILLLLLAAINLFLYMSNKYI